MNYFNTFIAVSADTLARVGSIPPGRGEKKTIALLEYELIAAKPYTLTQEDVLFTVHTQRKGILASELKANGARLRQQFFSYPMACMRTSPLPKTYGWGLHFNEEGKVALVAMQSTTYKRLSSDKTIDQTQAMRNKRVANSLPNRRG